MNESFLKKWFATNWDVVMYSHDSKMDGDVEQLIVKALREKAINVGYYPKIGCICQFEQRKNLLKGIRTVVLNPMRYKEDGDMLKCSEVVKRIIHANPKTYFWIIDIGGEGPSPIKDTRRNLIGLADNLSYIDNTHGNMEDLISQALYFKGK